jgi:transposase
MSRRDCSKQGERRQRIKKTTLVVGVDIGSEFNAVALMSKEGEVFGEYPKVYNSREGFEYFLQVVEAV